MLLLEAVSATPITAIRFREAVLAAAPALAEGRAELADQAPLLPETEDAILGGIVSLATRQVIAGGAESRGQLGDFRPGSGIAKTAAARDHRDAQFGAS